MVMDFMDNKSFINYFIINGYNEPTPDIIVQRPFHVLLDSGLKFGPNWVANYLLGKTKSIDFGKPNYKLDREDNNKIRELILNMPYKKWKDMGFSKGSLHYLKQNARSNEPFKIYGKVREKLVNVHKQIN